MSVRVKHINDDATYLITFSIPEDSNIPYPQLKDFTVLTDPWISGSWQLLHPKIVLSRATGQCCVQSLAELNPPPNVVVVSQDKPDHCHEKSLKQLDAQLQATTIYAHSGAAKRIRGWKYFPNDKVVSFLAYGIDDPEASLVRFSIPAIEDLHKYPGITPGELTMAFMAPKYDIAGVHNGIGFTYRPPMYVDPTSPRPLPSLLPLVPVKPSEDSSRLRADSTRSIANFSRRLDQDYSYGLGLNSTTPTVDTFAGSMNPPRRRKTDSLTRLNLSPYQSIDDHATPPDSPTRSTTTIETRTTATEYSTQEPYKVEQPIQLAPEWILPPTPTLTKSNSRPAPITSPSTSSSLHRLKSAISVPNLQEAARPRTPKKKKSLNLRAHKRSLSSDQPITISTPHTYTTDPHAPPLPNSPMSAFYPLTPTTTLPIRPVTPFSPTSTIAGPKTISILYVPHGISYAVLEPWVTSHLISTAALPLTLLLHPFDSVRNLWFLGGHVIQGGQHGAEIATALMAKQWISTHDGAKEESGWLVKKVVKRVFSREEVGRIMATEDDLWDYKRTPETQKPRTGVDVLRVGQEIAISA